MATKRPPGLIYDEADIDAVTRTMLGEAANQGDDGLAAVAHVLVNRLEKGGYGGSLYKVAHAPKQFSAWNSGALGGNNLVNMSADDPRYQQARAIAEQVLNGQLQDNTGGAVNYFAPAGMTGKNGTVKGEPKWASQMSYTTTIGGHKFYSDGAVGAADRLANGTSVSDIQQQLAQRGFNPGPIDGIRGPQTTAAIKAFQKANGLAVDGIVGPQTMAALNRAGSARPTTLPQPPGGMRPLPTLPPPPLIPNEMMPERAQFKPLPAPPPLTPQTSDPNGMIGLGNGVGYGPGWQTLNTLKDISAGVYPRPAPPPPGPASPVAPPPPTVPAGGFNLGAVLGGLGSNIQGGLTNAGQALTTTASNAIEGTRNAIGTTAQNAGDLLKSELMGTVKGRTLLFNTALGLPAPGSRNPTRYGNTFAERQENARRREAMAYGLPYVPPQTGVRTSLSLRPSSPLPTVPAPRSNRPAPRNTGRWEGVLDEFGMIL